MIEELNFLIKSEIANTSSRKEIAMSLNDAMLKVYIFLKNNEGASGIEYAIIAAMVAVVLAGFTTSISGGVEDIFEEIQKAIGLTTS
tara:strand:- start:560 stop:820 length:261 start_codon:yes stop_codon:yes gene_type:complete